MGTGWAAAGKPPQHCLDSVSAGGFQGSGRWEETSRRHKDGSPISEADQGGGKSQELAIKPDPNSSPWAAQTQSG